MIEALKPRNSLILILSVIGLYLLAPSLDPDIGIFISLCYALILIVSSKLVLDRAHLIKYSAFLAIDLVTYYILFSDQPWDFLFGSGIWASSAAPLVGCSVMMSFAGWLLIKKWSHRWLYVFITLGLQVPVGLFIGGDMLQDLFGNIAQILKLTEGYPEALQIWQFEWMLTYYLPVYFFARSGK